MFGGIAALSSHATWRYAALFAALLLPTVVHAEVGVPKLQVRVTDLTGTLSKDERAVLERKLADFEARKGCQIAVLIVPTTQPETIEQYSLRVAKRWKLGRRGIDDGVLLLVARSDRKLRIEVGRGLEGVIPDSVAKRVVMEVIAPQFSEGRFYQGISAGVQRIMSAIEADSPAAWHSPPANPAAR